ncbi:hypothetical protein EVAR_81651_1 [Eumeta japonica]|uniref:Uncharacterized protein n=1 Tax=Eumeta variegata TaxID=151549 RepID=A0A4C1V240_EUMVA|nr:hypothetical protein EVAR_81651_1 [Eumeta japonica]
MVHGRKELLKNNLGMFIKYYLTAGNLKTLRHPCRSMTAPVHMLLLHVQQLGRSRLCKWFDMQKRQPVKATTLHAEDLWLYIRLQDRCWEMRSDSITVSNSSLTSTYAYERAFVSVSDRDVALNFNPRRALKYDTNPAVDGKCHFRF